MIIENPYERYPMEVNGHRRREAEAYARRTQPPGPPQPGTPHPDPVPHPGDSTWPCPRRTPLLALSLISLIAGLTLVVGSAGGMVLVGWAG